MLYQFLLNFVDTFSFLNVFKYLTFRTGLSFFTSLVIVLVNKSHIIEFIKKDLNNNDYLMIKASLATGFNNIVKDLKGLN